MTEFALSLNIVILDSSHSSVKPYYYYYFYSPIDIHLVFFLCFNKLLVGLYFLTVLSLN